MSCLEGGFAASPSNHSVAAEDGLKDNEDDIKSGRLLVCCHQECGGEVGGVAPRRTDLEQHRSKPRREANGDSGTRHEARASSSPSMTSEIKAPKGR